MKILQKTFLDSDKARMLRGKLSVVLISFPKKNFPSLFTQHEFNGCEKKNFFFVIYLGNCLVNRLENVLFGQTLRTRFYCLFKNPLSFLKRSSFLFEFEL